MGRPFSVAWTLISVVLFLAVELLLGTFVGPLVVGKYVSPPFHLQLQMAMHLASFFVGGTLVGILSPGIRLAEPAVGAFASVVVVWLVSFFMPTWFYGIDLFRMLIGGGIAMLLALLGAYWGEQLMGNIHPDAGEADATARGRLRAKLWNQEDGLFLRRKDRQ